MLKTDTTDEIVGTTKWARSFTGTHLRQQTVSYTFDQSTNRNTAWGYDADGRTLSGDGVNNTYDAAGLLREADNNSGALGVIQFDGDGNRARQNTEGLTSFYLRSSVLEQTVAEIQTDGTRDNGFIYQDDEMIATLWVGGVFWQHRDPSNRSRRPENRRS